jgi:hypothetical protein
MPDPARQGRVQKLREAYDGYFAHLRLLKSQIHGDASSQSLARLLEDDVKVAELAMKLAIAEITAPV